MQISQNKHNLKPEYSLTMHQAPIPTVYSYADPTASTTDMPTIAPTSAPIALTPLAAPSTFFAAWIDMDPSSALAVASAFVLLVVAVPFRGAACDSLVADGRSDVSSGVDIDDIFATARVFEGSSSVAAVL